MKKILAAVVLTITMVMCCPLQGFAKVDTSNLNKEIAALESEIIKLQDEEKKLGENVNAIMGSVVSTDPFIIEGSGAGDDCTRALLSGVKYFIVRNPDDGELTAGYFYRGTHKYTGTTTITIGKDKYTAYVFDKFQNIKRWRSLGDIIKDKKAQIDKLNTQKEVYAQSLDSFSTDNYNQIILQVGNNEMYGPGAQYSFIDASAKDISPVVINGSTMVPIRAIVEAYGGNVAWDGSSKKTTLTLGENQVEIIIGSTTAMVNGEKTAITTPAQIINSKSMVPMRFVLENLGITVEWLGEAKVIRLSYGKGNMDINLVPIDAEYYDYTDDVMGARFIYPQEFGKPEINPYGYYSVTLKSEKGVILSRIEITYMGFEETESYRNGEGNIPLSDKNSGIEMIQERSTGYRKEVRILGSNEQLIIVKWYTDVVYEVSEADYPDKELAIEKDRMEKIISDILDSFTMSEEMG